MKTTKRSPRHDGDGTQVAKATGTPFMVVLTPVGTTWTAQLMDEHQMTTAVAGEWPSVSRALLEGLKAAGARS